MPTNNLGLAGVTAGQTGKETTITSDVMRLGEAITEAMDIDLTAANQSITLDNLQRNAAFNLKNATVVGRTVTFSSPTQRPVLVYSDAANTKTISLICGSTTIVVAIGALLMVILDGTANGMKAFSFTNGGGGATFTALSDAPASYASKTLQDVRVNAGETGLEFYKPPYDLAVAAEAVPTASEILMRWVAPRAVSFVADMVGSQGKAATAATAQTDYLVKKNGTTVATIRWAIAGTVGAWLTGAAWSVAAGDVITIEAPASPDATHAKFGITLAGTR